MIQHNANGLLEGKDIKNCNDPTSPAACFQCTGVGLTTSSLTEGMQDALDALSRV